MPLPIRDMSGAHLSLCSSVAEFHRKYPLSRYSPTLAVLHLLKMRAHGVDMAKLLGPETWMNLAALDDLSADFCLRRAAAAWKTGADAAAINSVFNHAAAPYLVPMMQPVPPSSNAPMPLPLTVQLPVPVPAPVAAVGPVVPPPPPPPQQQQPQATAAQQSASDTTVVSATASCKPPRLQSNVARVIGALAAKEGRDILGDLEDQAGRLQAMSGAQACKALREIGSKVGGAKTADRRRIIDQVLCKYEAA